MWKYECKRVIVDRFSMFSDVIWFDKVVVSLVEEEFGEEKVFVVDCGVDVYFVDFLRDVLEVIGKLLRCLKFFKRWCLR